MDIKSITQQKQWDDFVRQCRCSFLHSWAWGELNKVVEDNVVRIGFYNQEELVGVALIIVVKARRGAFLLIPHGPLAKNEEDMNEIMRTITPFLRELGKKYNTSFVRVSALLPDAKEHKQMFQNLKYRPAPIYMHAEHSWVLSLEKTQDELLMDMRKTHRNLIRRADKDGVEVTDQDTEENLKAFCRLYDETVQKHGFTPFSYSFLRTELDSFNKCDDPNISAHLYLATYQGDVLSGAIIVHYGDSAFYHHGANSLKNPKIPSSYALQWRAIQDAQQNGKTKYNFWGITKSEDKKHPWYGLSSFKKGFGGENINYVHAYDMPFTHKYWIPFFIDKFRMWKRGV